VNGVEKGWVVKLDGAAITGLHPLETATCKLEKIMIWPEEALANVVAGVLRIGLNGSEPHTVEVVPLELPSLILKARARWIRSLEDCLPSAEGQVDEQEQTQT